MDYSKEFKNELEKPIEVYSNEIDNYVQMIDQCLLSIRMNKKIIDVNSQGTFKLNKILVREARESIKEMQEAIQIFANKIS